MKETAPAFMVLLALILVYFIVRWFVILLQTDFVFLFVKARDFVFEGIREAKHFHKKHSIRKYLRYYSKRFIKKVRKLDGVNLTL